MATWIRTPAPYDHDKSPAENRQRDSGSVRCGCGAEVNVDPARYGPDYAASCKCGALFNLSGQALAPREQWEENTDDDY